MQTTKIIATSALALVVLSLQTAHATQPSASGNGRVAAGSSVSGNFSLGRSGTSTSFAQNSQSATANLAATTNYTAGHKAVNAGITGTTTTQSAGKAYNVSTGTGSGSATSAGGAKTFVQGQASIHGISKGFSGGFAGTQTHDKIVAGTNQGSYVVGQTTSGFDTQIQYARTAGSIAAPAGTIGGTNTAGVRVATQTTGYASGANTYGALDGMNAAGYANIGATGKFFSKAGVAAGISVTAP